MKQKILRNKKMLLKIFVILLSTILLGCSATELEERCFPVVTVVGYEDEKVTYAMGFPSISSAGEEKSGTSEVSVPLVKEKNFMDSKSKYESRLNKLADYNHLKVIVLEEDFIQQISLYENMLDYLSETEEYPRNTYVCIVDDVEDLLELEKNLPKDLGTYLEEYLNNHERQSEEILTLGDLIDEKENKRLVLYVPYLEVEDSFVEWGGYYTIGKNLPPVKFE